MTITLELPEDLAAALSDVPEADRNTYAVALLRDALRAGWYIADPDDGGETDAMDEEAVAAIARGIAQMEAGQLRTQEQVDASVDAALVARRRERAATQSQVAETVAVAA